MHEAYEDIRSRIPGAPLWWDENGVPRYAPFSPKLLADIYADEGVLLSISCQNCAALFHVAMSRHNRLGNDPRSLADRIREGSIHYGDPPNVGCCQSGATMNCDDLAVLEYWHRQRYQHWERDTSLEIVLEPVKPAER